MDSLNKTRRLFYIKVHEAKKALIKDIGPVNGDHLTVLCHYQPLTSQPPCFIQCSIGFIDGAANACVIACLHWKHVVSLRFLSQILHDRSCQVELSLISFPF